MVLYFHFLLKKNCIFNNYPHGIFCVDYKNNKKVIKENALRINIKKRISSKQKYNSEIKISRLVKNDFYSLHDKS